MEKWQKGYLTANLPQLLELTRCNKKLLARLSADGLLSTADVDTIRSSSKQQERTGLLYEILQTRRGGYGAMSRALSESKQLGAHEIFRQGYIKCLPDALNISFLGETRPLLKYLNEAEIREIVEEHVDIIENKGFEAVPLLRHAPPPHKPPYIHRKLFKRNVVKPELFQVNSSDIFVFKGVNEFFKLAELVRPQIASLSSLQLEKVNCRFIRLENDEDWKDICDIATAPVHLIKYEEETKSCVLEGTTGGSKIIKDHIIRGQKMKNPDMAISEETFVDNVVNDFASGVCICDSPGMGKTLLLAKISKRITACYPDRLVAFIPLSQFIKSVASDGIPPYLSKTVALNFLVEYLAASSLAQDILSKILSKDEIRLELLFDAFDEVPTQFISFTKKLLAELVKKLPNAKIYVTSRPHMRKELEDTLGVLSYDILPFSEANQIEFLVSFWKNQNKVGNDEKLEQFAKRILVKVKTSLTENEQNMTGIPLQCRLLAEVYSRNAKLYATRDVLFEDCCTFEGSLPQLYRKYVDQSFEKLSSQHEDEDALLPAVQKYHMVMALRTLFPDFELCHCQELTGSLSKSVEDLSISIGILERRFIGSEPTVEFVHRTFAEYFVSDFIAQVLSGSLLTQSCLAGSKEGVCKILLEEVLMTREVTDTDEVEDQVFINSFVVYFLNFFVEFYRPLTSIQLLAKQFTASVPSNHLHPIFLGCARNNHANLLQLIHNILLHVDKNALDEYKKKAIPSENRQRVIHLLNVASVFSSVPFMNELFALATKCFEYDLGVVCQKMPLHLDTPLHFAIERANVEMVQFFSAHISMESRNILLSCVLKSNGDPPQIVKRKAEICKMLLKINGNLLTEANYTLYDSVHVDLIKVLIQTGADARATKSGETIVHCSAGYMQSRHFHELCSFLISEHKAEDLFLANEPNWESPLPYIFRKQKNISVENCRLILGIPGVDVNEKDDHGNNLFLISVQEKHKMELLDLLVEREADVHAINGDKRNALHLAAQANNTPILKFLLHLGLNYRLQDSKGNSFLHILMSEQITAEKYGDIVSLLSAKGQTDIFQMRNENGHLPIHLAVDSLELEEDTLQLFKSNMVDFNADDNEGCSVLVHAALGGRSVQFLRILVDMGADIMKRNVYGETFTHRISNRYSAEQYHQLVDFLISKGFAKTFTTADNDGATPLHWAAFHIELLPKTLELIHCKLVKESKVDINVPDEFGKSILMLAAEGKRNITFLKSLLDMGSDVMLQDKNGFTFAHWVSFSYSAEEYYEIIKLLIERRHGKVFQMADTFGATPLHYAVFIYDSHRATWDLIRKKLVETRIVNINSTDNEGLTMLMCSIKSAVKGFNTYTPITFNKWDHPENKFLSHRSIETGLKTDALVAKKSINHLRTLVDMGADIYIQNKEGQTFLHYFSHIATAEQYHEVVEFLINRGEQNVFAVADSDRVTPIHVAVLNLELLEATLKLFDSSIFQSNIADINSTDTGGNSILIYAAMGKRSVRFLKTLIKMGADIHIQDKDGNNVAHFIPLVYSAEQYHEIVEFLINRGEQNVFAVANSDQVTPIHVAVSNLELLEATLKLLSSTIFQTNIVDINSTDTRRNSILMHAAMGKRSVRVLKTLIEMGADIHIQDKDGDTFTHFCPHYYSAEKYHEIVEFLVSRGEQKVFAVANTRRRTPIHKAVLNLELLETTLHLFNFSLFQTNIVDINSTDTRGNSILMLAAMGKRSVRVLKTLIEMGTDIRIQNDHGNSFAHLIPYVYSAEQYHEIVEFLISRSEQSVFTLANNYGQTPIQYAAFKLELLPKTLDYLSATSLLPNHQLLCTSGQETFLHGFNSVNMNSVHLWALRGKRSLQFVKHLISLGVEWSVKSNHNTTLAHRSASEGRIDHLKYFVEFECDVNVPANVRLRMPRRISMEW